MGEKIIDFRNHEKQIENVLKSFYEAHYMGNTLKLYSYLDTFFQKSVPLNYFLIHSDYDIELGFLKEITRIEVDKEKNQAMAEVIIKLRKKEIEIQFSLKMDYGGWKLEGEIFHMLGGM
ncbi:hypothetical protein SAMN05446037_101978 [Anaerovirgula multivorans]|uniref:Uncharacterized protein n=1 Tax=Anaerovirgula multivorans TaxID=312168 RepID=A0A239H2J5_9FIRM|nr:hypothetical protein [Anaerovirgula multivorans]SNS75402.1 hypothetical protein SAMN05446037_101978 [Anaerovirgula multivorans]